MTVTLLLNLVFLVGLHYHAFASVVVYVAVLMIQGLVMLMLARRFIASNGTAVAAPGLGREMVAFGFRGYAGAMSSFLWMRSTLFILEAFHGPAAVGIFSIAQQMAEKLLLPAQVIRDVIYRDVSSADRQDATQRMDRYLRLTVVALVPLLIVGAWLAPDIIHLMFGSKFDASAPIFRILFVGSVIAIVPTLLLPYFLGQLGRPGLLSLLAWLNVVINLSLAFWLIPGYAETGAAGALVATQFIGTALLFVLYLRYSGTGIRSAICVSRCDLGTVARQLSGLFRPRGAQL